MSGATINIESGSEQECSVGVRLIVLNLPEDEGEGLGFRLTRTLWDPYPWVREVTLGGRADLAGLKTGDCLLQADGKDLLGLPVGQVAGLIRGDGAGRGVSLLVWNCGVDPRDDPELLWSVGGGTRGERSRRALAGVVKALSCCVCAATATRALNCARSHLYCEACWSRLERCALCRETLPAKDSPYARNLVAEQVFEAIATEYEIKNTQKNVQSNQSQNRSPNLSPASGRKGQYQFSMMNRTKKTVQFTDKYRQNYASDPNIHRSIQTQPEFVITRPQPTTTTNSTNSVANSSTGNPKENGGKANCCCQKSASKESLNKIPEIKVDSVQEINCLRAKNCSGSCQNLLLQHKLVARLRPACSMADLNSSSMTGCELSQSLTNISNGAKCNSTSHHTGSLDDLKNKCGSSCDSAVLLLSPPQPIYVLACEHSH